MAPAWRLKTTSMGPVRPSVMTAGLKIKTGQPTRSREHSRAGRPPRPGRLTTEELAVPNVSPLLPASPNEAARTGAKDLETHPALLISDRSHAPRPVQPFRRGNVGLPTGSVRAHRFAENRPAATTST